MSTDSATDENEPVAGVEPPATDAQKSAQRTPPRVGAVPDSVVFIQPPPVE
ncbi:hypothetical protein [Nocardia colli]|uniref:hypothetical protein n=1 Tax=Nocardia colli TaxID=2545717 RepID=UPI00168D2CBA|nr:hypothetical protein [Nocardia colli]